MTVLGIETSCDETSVAVVRDGTVQSNIVSSQTRVHSEYGGVVPELATREHLRNFPVVVAEAFAAAKITINEIDLVAATQGPGLPSALMAGFQAGQGIAYVAKRPFLAINHHEAHLYSPWMAGQPPRMDFDQFEPSVSLIVSGGHTLLIHVKKEFEHSLLGQTKDDAAGECFDKTAKLLGLDYPGGPEIDRLSEGGNPGAWNFPRPMLHEPNDDFSFSGLKTSVRYFLEKNPRLLQERNSVADLCASIQAAIVDVLVSKCIRAALRSGVRCVTASGGVTLNRRFRKQFLEAATRAKLRARLAEKSLCTDNAAMIALLAERKFSSGVSPTPLDAEICLSWNWPGV